MAPASRVLPQQWVLAAGLLVIGICFGGGGAGAGLMNLVVQIAALAVLFLRPGALWVFFREAPRPAAMLVAITLCLPLLQCIPLPPAVWQALPGRDLVKETLGLVGRQDAWFPFSVDVRRTFGAFLSLLAPLTILTLAWQAGSDRSRRLLMVVVVCGLGVVLLGAQQLALGNRQLVLFAQAFGSGDLQGTFANHNATGLFIDIALCGLIGIYPQHRTGGAWLVSVIGVAMVLLVGLILTRSRSGMVLVVVPVALLAMRLWFYEGRGALKRVRLWIVGGLVAFVALGAVVAGTSERARVSLSRFDELHDARPAIWSDTVVAIRRYWPAGSGIGTFDEVIQVDEALESLTPGRAGRAHNEFLETTLESGILGPVLVASWVALLVYAAWRCRERNPVRLAAAAIMALIALQSILDYPLRSQALLCVAGLAIGLVLGGWLEPAPQEKHRRGEGGFPRSTMPRGRKGRR